MKRELHKALAMLLTLVLMLTVFPVVSVDASSETTYNGVDYALVYDYNFYMGHADLKKVYGNNKAGALKHFVTYGMKEGRQASPNFNVNVYRANYIDLQNAFGSSLPKYYKHYIQYGKKEGRNAVSLISAGNTGNVTPAPSSSSGNTAKTTPANSGSSGNTGKVTPANSGSSGNTGKVTPRTVQVTLDTNGVNTYGLCNGVVYTTQTVGAKYQFPDNPADSPEYTFVGWFTEKVNGQQVTSSSTVNKTTPHTLYAHWEMSTSSQWHDEYSKYGMTKSMFTVPGVYKEEYNAHGCGYYIHTYIECSFKKTDFIVWSLPISVVGHPNDNAITYSSGVKILESAGNDLELRTYGSSPLIKSEIDSFTPDLITRTDNFKAILQNKDFPLKEVVVGIYKTFAEKDVKSGWNVITSVRNYLVPTEISTATSNLYSTNWNEDANICRGLQLTLKDKQFLGKADDIVMFGANVTWPTTNYIPECFSIIKTPDRNRGISINYSFVVYSYFTCKNEMTVNRRRLLSYNYENGKMNYSHCWAGSGFGVVSD